MLLRGFDVTLIPGRRIPARTSYPRRLPPDVTAQLTLTSEFSRSTDYSVIAGQRGYQDVFSATVIVRYPAVTREGFSAFTAFPHAPWIEARNDHSRLVFCPARSWIRSSGRRQRGIEDGGIRRRLGEAHREWSSTVRAREARAIVPSKGIMVKHLPSSPKDGTSLALASRPPIRPRRRWKRSTT